MKTRQPSVAGSFYPGSALAVNELLEKLYNSEEKKIDTSLAARSIIGGVVPHAGYIYSGYEAVHFFEIIKQSGNQYDTIVIVNPNHSGLGAYAEADSSDYWETPLGKLGLDSEFIEAMNLPVSDLAQRREHSAEVMLPFLQRWLDYDFKIVPVCILRQNPETAREVAGKIHSVQQQSGKKILILASSDFSHFVEPRYGEEQDDLVLEEIKNLDSDRLYINVLENNISVCGYGPIMTLIEYAKLVSDQPKSTILARGNSGKTSPSSSVVDYISILFYT